MKNSIGRATLIVFSVGILAFIIYYVIGFLVTLWDPVISLLDDEYDSEHYVTIPLAIILSLSFVFIVTLILSRERHFKIFSRLLARVPLVNWFLGEGKIPEGINDMPGALVRFNEGGYYIAALIGDQKFLNKMGKVENMYKLYCPSAPIPWSGLPIIFAKHETVILLKISFGDVYRITTSFGRGTPDILEELSVGVSDVMDLSDC